MIMIIIMRMGPVNGLKTITFWDC